MKQSVIFSGIVLLAGCASAPRPYDGVLGYRVEPVPAGLQVISIDEAKVGAERIRKNLTKVCSARLGTAFLPSNLHVQSEAPFEQQVNMNVQIPVGMQSTGSNRVSNGQGPGAAMKSSLTQTEGVIRNLRLRKTVALCSKTP